jgi:hypothetical protein
LFFIFFIENFSKLKSDNGLPYYYVLPTVLATFAIFQVCRQTRVFGTPEKHYMLDAKDLKQIKKKVEKSKSPEVRIVGHSNRTLKIPAESRVC